MVCVFGAESQTHTVSFIQRLHRQVVNAVQPKPKARPILRTRNDLISIVVILSPKFPKLSNFTLPSTIHSTQKHRGNHHHCIKRHHGGWKGCYQGVVLAGACAEGRAGEELGWRMWLAVGVFPNAHTIGDAAIPYQEQHFFGWSCVLRIDRNIHTESNRIDQTNPKDQHALTVDQSQKPQPRCPIG